MSTTTKLTRPWLLAGTMLTSLACMPALAQTETPAPTTDAAAPTAAPAKETPADATEVVITGSRIKHSEFNSPSPVQIITKEKSSLAGMISATQVLQSSSIAAGAGQINNTFSGYVVDGGDGINTLSLRGLGAQRTLILINGRRMPPAGVGGTVGPVDLNFIPQSMVQRYEILKDGASSVYGSDAVSGVVNIITEKNFDGLHLEVDNLRSEKDGGDSYSASVEWGKTFDRGSLLVSGEYYKQEPLTLAQRPNLACPQTFYYKANGARADRIDPVTGTYKCYASSGIYQGVLFGAFSGDIYYYKKGVNTSGIPDYPTYTSGTQIDFNPKEALSTTAISPVKRGSLFIQGNYRPEWLGGGELYTELMFGQRKSAQTNWMELFPYYSDYATVSPLYGYDLAQPVVLHPANSSQTVDFSRYLGGVRGDWKGWSLDAYVSFSRSAGKYNDTVVYGDRINWGTGFDQVNFDYMDYTTGDACGVGAPVGCVPLNLFTEAANTQGKLTDAEEAWYFTVDHGRTLYEQTIAEATATGDLFQLPAGPLGAAFGISFRQDKIDDIPGELSITGNSYNRSHSGRTMGTDRLSEVFGELEIPVIRHKPGFEDLTLNLSTRYSEYKSVGNATTYKVGFDWALDNRVRLRGTAGTSFRAPALYELFLNHQTSYLDQLTVDPCIRWGVIDPDGSPHASATVRANCAADGVPGNYTGAGSSALIDTGGGLSLRPETSYATTFGIVLTPPNMDFKLAMDFWKTKISNQISSSGAAVVGACYASVEFRSKPGFCDLFLRDPVSHSILTIDGSYRNIPNEATAGIDFTFNYEHEFNFGTLTSDAQFSYYKYDKVQLYSGAVINNYSGLIGQQKWAGDVQTKFKHKDWTFAWTANYTGNASNIGFYGETGNTGTNVSYAPNATYAASVKPFVTHDFEVRYKSKTYELMFGVNNAFGTDAPIIGSGVYSGSAARMGNYPFTSQYYSGLIGRQFYLRMAKDF